MSGTPDDAIDAGLLSRLREAATRPAAFEELVARSWRDVFTVCRHVTGNSADAEDAVQETFLAVHASLARFRGDSRLSTWVHRIAIRAALRVRARRRRAADIAELDLPARGADPILSREFDRRLAEAMNRLTADHRIVLSLFAVEGLTHTRIAEILGVPEGTVWSRLHTARRRLAAELG